MHNYPLSDILYLIFQADPVAKGTSVLNPTIIAAAELIAMLEDGSIAIQRITQDLPSWMSFMSVEQKAMYDQGIIRVNESVLPKPAHKEAYEFIRSEPKHRSIGWYLGNLPSYENTLRRVTADGLLQPHRHWLFNRAALSEKGTRIVQTAKSELNTFFATDDADLSKVGNQSCLIAALLVKSNSWKKVYKGVYKGKTISQKRAIRDKVDLLVHKARIKNDSDNNLALLLNALSRSGPESSWWTI